MSFNKNLSNKYKLNRGLEALDLSTFNTSNQLVFNLGTNQVNIDVTTPTSNRNYTIPDVGSDGTFCINTSGTVPLNGSLIPDKNNVYDIGSSSYNWKNFYLDGIANIGSTIISGNSIQLGAGSDYNILNAQNKSGDGINTWTFLDATDNVVGASLTQTLQNKTLNSTNTFEGTINTSINATFNAINTNYCTAINNNNLTFGATNGVVVLESSIIPDAGVNAVLGSATSPIGAIYLTTDTGTPNALNYYENVYTSISLGGFSESQTAYISLVRIGSIKLFNIQAVSATFGSTAGSITSSLSSTYSRYYPTYNSYFTIMGESNGSYCALSFYINTNGGITISPLTPYASTFSENATNCGVFSGGFAYI